MRTEGNVSKVAICPKCKGFTLACHIDSLCERTEKEFTELTNEGFEVKLETDKQVKEYRTLTLHLVQKLKRLGTE